ncbi:unnamed protein product [Heterotrigona itama]|uniref:Peptidase aspartic putative domain-containing protein n=1 Tax=Heterotrigona itama TaxID=395501 RepID=A0A6V7H553_9HYME|nr:unnamed protein product [Heterotrigona itama]
MGKQRKVFVANTITSELLMIARINVLNKHSQAVNCRTLIDTCATTNFISEGFAKQLGIQQRRYHIPIDGLNTISTVARATLKTTIKSRNSNYSRTLTFLIVPKIFSVIPENRSKIKIPKNIKLADPTFDLRQSAPTTSATHATKCHSITTLQADLTRFWKIEEGPQIQRLSESDAACEKHFRTHTTRNSEGRYVVTLPFNNKKQQLDESRA